MDTLKTLEDTRDFLRNPDNWCGDGRTYSPEGGRCTGAAAIDASPLFWRTAVWRLDRLALRLDPSMEEKPLSRITMGPTILYNDSHTHAEVLEFLNIAIAELQAEHQEAETPCLTAA